MANVDAVPAGKYGKAALEKLGAWTAVKDSIARPRTCAPRCCWWRAARRRSASSTAPTPRPSPGVKIVATFPEDSHPPIIYPCACTKDAKNADAKAFLDFLRSAKARTVVREAGLHGPGEVSLLDMTPEEWTAVRLSLLVATTATLASLPFGVAIAWLLARRSSGARASGHAGPPAADPAARRHRLPAADLLRQARADRRLSSTRPSASSSPSAGPVRRSPAR
jgi:hypothetical protein